MLFVHPIVQSAAILVSLYVLYLGIQRFRSLHLKHKTVFRWNRHVVIGEIVVGVFLIGMLGGTTVVYVYWHGFLITGTHGKVALLMLPFILFCLFTGLYMNRKRKHRRFLPVVHSLNNLILLTLALTQVVSGWWVYKTFVLGG